VELEHEHVQEEAGLMISFFLQSFDAVGWVIRDMIYNVFGGTLSLTRPLSNFAHLFAYRAHRLCAQFSDLVLLQLISHVLVFSCPYMHGV